jgi:transcriptional antiterminator RfaH
MPKLDAALRNDVVMPKTGTNPNGGRMPKWAVVFTHPNAEMAAVEAIIRAGYPCYLPLYRATFPHKKNRMMPLFPRYAFVHHSDGQPWTPIRYANGVNAILMNGQKPGYASEATVSALQAGEALRRCPQPRKPVWHHGAPCRLATGPCQGADAVVLSFDADTNHATVAIMLFGHLREIKVSTDRLIEGVK